MNDWPQVAIGEVAEIFDGPHATPRTVDIGPIFLGIGALQHGRINLGETRHVTPEDFRTWTRRVKPKSGAVVFSYETRLGEAAMIPDRFECCLGRRMGLVRANGSRLDPRFFLYVYLSPSFQDFIRSRTIRGATVDRIALKEFPSFPIPLPALHEQRAISSMLGSLDDKIEVNKRINETLETTVRAIYKDWFVDFGPTRAKAEGRAPYHTTDVWSLFPDRLDDQDRPEGWNVLPLSDVFDFLEGPGIRNWQYTNTAEGTRFINIRCIQDHDLRLVTANRVSDAEANGKYAHFHLREDDIVVSTSGTLGRWALVRSTHLPLVLNTSVIRFRPKAGFSTLEYLRCYVDHPNFVKELEMRAVGSVQKNFGPVHLKQMTVLTPPDHVGAAFASICSPAFKQ